jgi:hypothetical protein
MFSVESQRGLPQRIWKLSTQTVEDIAMIISKLGERSLLVIQDFFMADIYNARSSAW